ncbi:MAG: YitT family protein [Clostridia bacterium]|nr:YitT family protein [Clostridia bacterium]
MPTKRGKTIVLDTCSILAGAALYAAAVCIFIQPNGLFIGGFSGLALILNRLFGLPLGATVFALNIPLFFIGFKKLGRNFIIKTTAATAAASLFMELCSAYVPPFYCEKLLACIAGGILSGAGLALVFLRGASTGGSDIIGKLINAKHPHLPLGRLLMFFDISVIGLSALLFHTLQDALYSTVMIGMSAAALDYLLYGAKSGKMLLIITKRGEALSRQINRYGHRGATLVPAIGAYTLERRCMLVVAVRANEIGTIETIIYKNDPHAFTTLLDARDIKGLGFPKRDG